MNEIIEKFVVAVNALARRLVEAVGGYRAAGIDAALHAAKSNLVGKAPVWELGGVYDPEFPVRLAIIEAALAGNPYVDYLDEGVLHWLEYFKAGPAAKKYLDEDGWRDLLKELAEFGEDDLGYEAAHVKKYLDEEAARLASLPPLAEAAPPLKPVEYFHPSALPGCEEQPEDNGAPDDDFDA